MSKGPGIKDILSLLIPSLRCLLVSVYTPKLLKVDVSRIETIKDTKGKSSYGSLGECEGFGVGRKPGTTQNQHGGPVRNSRRNPRGQGEVGT